MKDLDATNPMTRPNIFLINGKRPDENRFTASWHYLLFRHPEIGQLVVDKMMEMAGRVPVAFVCAHDHPSVSSLVHPDFLLECEEFAIICEHKIGSPFTESKLDKKSQLESYCGLSHHRLPTLVALIAHEDSLVVPTKMRPSEA